MTVLTVVLLIACLGLASLWQCSLRRSRQRGLRLALLALPTTGGQGAQLPLVGNKASTLGRQRFDRFSTAAEIAEGSINGMA